MIDRIRERDDFVRLRREGTRVRIEPLWCSFVLDPTLVPPRVAFAIGRASGSAVQRNRLRRRLRALLRERTLPGGLYLIGTAAHGTELTFAELAARMDRMVASAAGTERR